MAVNDSSPERFLLVRILVELMMIKQEAKNLTKKEIIQEIHKLLKFFDDQIGEIYFQKKET